MFTFDFEATIQQNGVEIDTTVEATLFEDGSFLVINQKEDVTDQFDEEQIKRRLAEFNERFSPEQ